MAPPCAGCLKIPTGREFLTCTLCSSIYDLDCANVSSARFYSFYSTKTSDHKTTWKCPSCTCKQPKRDNSNTPVRASDHTTNNCEDEIKNNVTLRRKNTTQVITERDESIGSDDLSLLGDTIYHTTSPKKNIQTEPAFQNLSCIIAEELKENNTLMITQLQNTIQTEVNRAITQLKQHLKQETDGLKQLNNENKTEIEKLKQEMQIIKKENGTLRKEIADLRNKYIPSEIITNKTDLSKTDPQIEKQNLYLNNRLEELNDKINEEKYGKKIILYGLNEYENETEQILMEKLNNIFYDILGIDLNGYVEEIKRLGRRNYKRPVEIELLSKRMTDYILLNSNWFKNTGLYISKYLTMEQQQERQTLLKCLRTARENGQHAVIRDHKLYINGQLHIDIKENTNKNNENNAHAKFSQIITPDRMTTRQQQTTTLNQNKKPFRA